MIGLFFWEFEIVYKAKKTHNLTIEACLEHDILTTANN